MTRCHPIAARLLAALCFGAASVLVVVARSESPGPGLPPGMDPVKAGQELAATLRDAAPPADSSGVLRMRKPDGQTNAIPVTADVSGDTNSWQVTYQTTGGGSVEPERLTIIHTRGQPNSYLYAHGKDLDAAQRVTDAQAIVPFAGSDFWLMDLGLEFFHWPQQRLVKFEMRRSRSSRVLESVNPKPAPGGYSRVLSWVDVETDGLLRAEAYDAANQMVKEFSVGSVRKVKGRWQLQDVQIRNLVTKSRTKLEFNLAEVQSR